MSAQHSINQLFVNVSARIEKFMCLSNLWKENPKQAFKIFQQSNPEPSQFLEKINYYEHQNTNSQLIPNLVQIGILLCRTENIKFNFDKLTKNWKEVFAVNLNTRARLELQQLTTFMNEI